MLHQTETSIAAFEEDLSSAEVCGRAAELIQGNSLNRTAKVQNMSRPGTISDSAVQQLDANQCRSGALGTCAHPQYTGIRPGHGSQIAGACWG